MLPRFFVLEFNVEVAPKRWLPMEGAELNELIGSSDEIEENLTPPVKPDQLAALLDSLEAHGKIERWLPVFHFVTSLFLCGLNNVYYY